MVASGRVPRRPAPPTTSSRDPSGLPPFPPTPTRLRTFRRGPREERVPFGPFAVERHAVTDWDGRPRRSVVSLVCPDWVNVVALTPARELLLVWQHRFGTDARTLECPGGVLEVGESPEEGARRELAEETGYAPATLRLLGHTEPNPALQGNRCFTVLAEGCAPGGATAFDDLEELETVRVPLADAARLVDEGHVRHALSVVALERAYRTLR